MNSIKLTPLERQREIVDVDRIKYNAFIVGLSIQIANLKIPSDVIPRLSFMADQTEELLGRVRKLSKLREKLYESVAYYNELARDESEKSKGD